MDYKDNYRHWCENVADEHKQELAAIAHDETELRERFTLPLAFGTAGMRGTIALGISNMNVYTVARASKGLCDYICTLGKDAMARGVVVSYDTRRMSFEFALTTARVLAAGGVRVHLFEDVRPVPMCSFAIRHLGAIAGVMITASHNPKEYNGYKVYGEDGAQMSPEATAKVVEFIDKTPYFGIPLAQTACTDRSQIDGKDGYALCDNVVVIGKRVDEAYYTTIERLSLSPDAVARVGKSIRIVYSPIHGSGYKPVTTMLARMGIAVNVVEEQRDPDPDFSTVAMPNPEQPDALELGIALADRTGSDIVIGTDPDCDRMGIAIRDGLGAFVLLNGNQIGALLMDYILMRHAQEGTLPANAAVVKTIVTTRLADKIAAHYGASVYNVLTGFKFIGEKIKQWESDGAHTFLFGYEESYGYLSGTHARDKDAVVASMLFAEMYCYYSDRGVRLYDRLQELFATYGYFIETSKSIAFRGLDGMDKMARIMTAMRRTALSQIAGIAVRSKADLAAQTIVYADGTVAPTDLPKTDVIRYDLGNDEWVCVRPSGTEPKLKIYVSTCATDAQESMRRNRALQSALEILVGQVD